jgi:hypothetical protein
MMKPITTGIALQPAPKLKLRCVKGQPIFKPFPNQPRNHLNTFPFLWFSVLFFFLLFPFPFPFRFRVPFPFPFPVLIPFLSFSISVPCHVTAPFPFLWFSVIFLLFPLPCPFRFLFFPLSFPFLSFSFAFHFSFPFPDGSLNSDCSYHSQLPPLGQFWVTISDPVTESRLSDGVIPLRRRVWASMHASESA